MPFCEYEQSVGMVMDFGDLSQVVRPIIESMDHAMIVSEGDDHLRSILPEEQKTVIMHGPPTAENMSVDIGMGLEEFFNSGRPGPRVYLCSVRVWETPTSFAEYDGQVVSPCQKCASQ
jgi:6-pyruvoyltetrahydropterin/6-carboxytetrahydropterin synthase